MPAPFKVLHINSITAGAAVIAGDNRWIDTTCMQALPNGAGCEVLRATTSTDAMDIMQSQRIGLVIGQLDGRDYALEAAVVGDMRHYSIKTPILFLTDTIELWNKPKADAAEQAWTHITNMAGCSVQKIEMSGGFTQAIEAAVRRAAPASDARAGFQTVSGDIQATGPANATRKTPAKSGHLSLVSK